MSIQIKCPHCNFELDISDELKEFRHTICPACNKKIKLSEYFGDDFSALETIFIAKNEPEQVEVVSLLQGFGIKAHLKKVDVHNLIGVGRVGTGDNVAAGPVEIKVADVDKKKAEELVRDYVNRNENKVDPILEDDEMFAEDQDQIDRLFHKGTELYENEEFSLAEAKFQEALSLLPDSQEILYNLVLVYIAQKKIDLASTYLERVNIDDRYKLAKEIKKVENSLYVDFCTKCKHYNEEDGICYELKENIKRYPKRFVKKCNGKFFKKDLNKNLQRE